MVDYKLFEETATGRFYKVYKDGVEVSKHYTEREAIESAQEIKFQYWNSDVKYVHEYEVEVGLTDAGITEAQDYGTPQDTPPTITSTPSPSFTVNGIEQTYDMTQHVSDDGVSAVTYELLNILPNGLSFDANTGVLTYDGIEGAQVSQHQLRATDAVGSATSNSFDITIAASTSGVTVEQYKVLEFVFTASVTPTNPFDTYLLKLRLTDPNSQQTDVEGYFDGDGNGGQTGFVWKCRVCPDVVGDWSWATVAGDQADPQLAGLSGQFTVTSGTDVGGVSANGQFFEYQNGNDVFLQGHFLDNRSIGAPLGTSISTHVYMSQTHVDDADRAQLLSEQVNHHAANKINIYYSNEGDYQGQQVNPWTGTYPSADKTQMNLATWKAWDGYMEDFKDSGMHASMWGFADDWLSGYPTVTELQRLFRYAMARHSAYNHTSFTLGLEYNEQFTEGQMNTLGSYVQTKNPWNRLITVHHLDGCQYNFAGQAWCDYASVQSGFSGSPSVINACAISLHDTKEPNKPGLDEEFWHDLQGGGETTGRRLTWANFLGNGAGGGTGAGIKSFMRFLELSQIPHQRMTHNNAAVDGGGSSRFALSETNQHHVVYATSGTAFNFTVTGSGLTGYWYNPRSDTSTLQSIGTINSGAQLFTPPDFNDWVLWITSGANLNSGDLYATPGAAPTVVTISTTALGPLVDSLSAGQWGLLQSGGNINTLFSGTTSSSSIFEYAYRLCWDDHNKAALFYGGDDSPAGYTPKAIRYNDAVDAWDQLENPDAGGMYTTVTPRHSYGQNVLDVPNRKWYYSTMGYNVNDFYSCDLDAPSENWVVENDININEVIDGSKSFAHFPARNSIVMATGEGTPAPLHTHIAERNNATGNWSDVWEDPLSAVCGLHLFAEYSGAHIPGQQKDGCVVFGGGSRNTKDIWRFDPDGTVTPLPDWPYATDREWSAKFTLINRDHATENILFFHDDEVEKHFAELDPRTGIWIELPWHNANVSSGDGSTFRSIAGPVTNYMAHLFCHFSEGGGDSKVYAYKHAESMTVDEVAADSDTLAVLDFETTGRCKEGEEFYIRGSTNPVIQDSYLLNHPNRSEWMDGNNRLTQSPGLNKQLGSNWYAPWMFTVNTNNPTANPVRYPKIVSSGGEFEDITGEAHPCLEVKLHQGDEQKGGGEMAVLLRKEGAGEAKPPEGWSFLTAGTGAEIWVRAAVWHDQNWIDTSLQQDAAHGFNNTGAKLWNIHGDESSQSLEETITTDTSSPPGFYHVYSDGGSENYADPSPSVYQQAGWRVMHMQIIVGDDGGSNGTVRCYLDEDPNPFFETTSSNNVSSVGGPLLAGLQYVATASENTNQGYWIYDFTSFTSYKDPFQSHSTMTRRYDNIVIRKDTRCPPLKPG